MIRVIQPPHRLRGGVHPPGRKEATAGRPIAAMPLPPVLRVALAQHMGRPAIPTVRRGDAVRRGQRIGAPAGYVSAPVHAPTSGEVTGLVELPGPAGALTFAVEIVPDGRDTWAPALPARPDWASAAGRDLVPLVLDAGVAGMGGAGFPTHVKLSPPAGTPIDMLIVNGAECEPFLTADHRLMVEHAADIWAGARLIRHILGARALRVAIEDDKPDAIAAMAAAGGAADGDVAIVALETAYPRGAEKPLIAGLTGREVPSGGLPMDVGAVVENVGTVRAVWDAVVNGRPQTERVTTVAGTPVAAPANVCARLGTPYAELIAFCGGTVGPVAKVVCGGPMMGLAQGSLDTCTTKTTAGLLLLTPAEAPAFASLPCIGCGRCVTACPTRLLPCEISRAVEAEDFARAEAYDAMDCIECGCCAYECPARRPLVQHLRQAKAWSQRQRATRAAEGGTP